MIVTLFAGAGKVSVVHADDAPSLFLLGGRIGDPTNNLAWRWSSTAVPAIITHTSPTFAVNQSVMYTMSSEIYMYVTGDKMTQLNLSGVIFTGGCGINNDTQEPGVSRLIRLYNAIKASSTRYPTQLTYNPGVTLSGYVVGMTVQTARPEDWTHNFNMALLVAPDDLVQRRNAALQNNLPGLDSSVI